MHLRTKPAGCRKSAEQKVAPDCGGITRNHGSKSHQPQQVNLSFGFKGFPMPHTVLKYSFLIMLLALSATILGCERGAKSPAPESKPVEPEASEATIEAWKAIRRGQAADKMQDNDAAIAHYSEAIRLDPSLSPAFNNRGLAWSRKRETEKAIADLDESIRLYPKLFVTWVNRGNAWRAKKNVDKALADFTKAIELAPDRFEPWEARGHAWREKGESIKGIKDFDEAIRLNPGFSALYEGRGRAWSDLGELDKAEEDFRRAKERE